MSDTVMGLRGRWVVLCCGVLCCGVELRRGLGGRPRRGFGVTTAESHLGVEMDLS